MTLTEACRLAKKEIKATESDFYHYHDSGFSIDITLSPVFLVQVEVKLNKTTVLLSRDNSPAAAKKILDIFITDFAEEKEGRGRAE
jgi:hypothetical protein